MPVITRSMSVNQESSLMDASMPELERMFAEGDQLGVSNVGHRESSMRRIQRSMSDANNRQQMTSKDNEESVISVRTTSTVRSRRKIDHERKLAAFREQKRQVLLQMQLEALENEAKAKSSAAEAKAKASAAEAKAKASAAEAKAKAEIERIEDEEQLETKLLDLNLGEDLEDEHKSVSSVPSKKSDVAKWVKTQSVITGLQDIQQQDKVRFTEPANNSINVPQSIRTYASITRPDDNGHQREPIIRQTFNNASFNSQSAAQPVDLRNFMARQTGADSLPEFHGNPEEWPLWIGRFNRSTKLCGFSEEENLLRLQRSLRGKAKETVISMLSSSCNLEDIIDVLKMRFGRPEQIIARMLDKAKNAVTPVDGDFNSLVDFAIAVKNFCAAAKTLDLMTYVHNPLLVEEFQRKLPFGLQLEWGLHSNSNGSKMADLQDLSDFLGKYAAAAVKFCDNSASQKKVKVREQCFVVDVKKCDLGCKVSHQLSVCPEFKKMSVQHRQDYVKKNHLCFSCLQKGHRVLKCSKLENCGKNGCERRHHPLLHFEKKPEQHVKFPANQNRRPLSPQEEVQPESFAVVSQVKRVIGNVQLKIVPVKLTGPKGEIVVNAFLDDGCSVTMLEEKVADELGLEGDIQPLTINWQGGRSDRDANSRFVSLKISGIGIETEYDLVDIRTKRNLCLPIQPLSNYKQLKKWTHLKDVEFPEPLQKTPSIVIGEDYAALLMAREVRRGPANAPVATLTAFGWVVHGRKGNSSRAGTSEMSMAMVEHLDPDEALHELVKEQFRLDALGVVNCQKLPQSKENERAEFLMKQTTRRVGDHWETGMLWKTDGLLLPESKTAALRRLKTLEKKMDQSEDYSRMYTTKIAEYIEKGFCRKLSPNEAGIDNERIWYLPHFGRINPNKPGKLRLVFDCAAKSSGTSLNDALLQGPDLMSPLLNVLLKFREREVAFSGDIRDMFHMVKIRQEDVPSLRFLWRGDRRTGPPDVYTMDVMVFGAVSSPYQAQWVKNTNAEEFRDQFAEAVDAIQTQHYVDDYLDSCSTVEDAIQKIMDVREIHRRGGFEIRGWLSNEPDVLKVVAPGEQPSDNMLVVKEDNLERVLGLHWDPKEDVFTFKVKFPNICPQIVSGDRIPTKRELLRLVMSLFDPLGFITHLTVRGRMLLQDVWKAGIGWDDKLSQHLETRWTSLLAQIMQIPSVIIGRCYAPSISSGTNIQLHVFCDASQQAFCSVAYLRVTGRGGGVSLNIVMSKSRVAPIKTTSIPRLELEAALIGTRKYNLIRKNLRLRIDSVVFWTDSRNVLCWLEADDPGKFKMYVAHRIGEILEDTDVSNWRWVPTAENVADDATRDAVPADLSSGSRWLNGPSFLLGEESDWPQEGKQDVTEVNMEDLEVKKNCCMLLMEAGDLIDVTDFSDWMRLIRVTAWVLRFTGNARIARTAVGIRKIGNFLLPDEIDKAIQFWIKVVQQECYAEELEDLCHDKAIEKSSRIARLSPFLLDGAICVKSRICNAPHLPAGRQYPVILDGKHAWTKLLIAWYHQTSGHHGVELICNELRQRYWIPGLKPAVKKAARDCMQCKLEKAKQIVPEMAALPAFRVTRPPRPFTYVGVDYFGPIEVVNGRKREKRYGVLFTCLSIRAVHLEVASSLSTDDFILAYNRFICRRGNPVEIWSDNGTNFRGADKELQKAIKELPEDVVGGKLANRGIKWNFIPPGAPHMGGAWERLVRSVKTAMRTILGNRTLNDALLATVLVEAEAMVNSRPLTTVSSDLDDPEAITPNCFLFGSTSVKQLPGVFPDGDLSLRKRWRHAQVLSNHFWSRWLKEYLPSLALRGKWNKDTPDVKVGELVFVADMNEQRNQWIKGVVHAVFPGKDKRVRVVDVRTAGGILRRPLAKLLRIQDWPVDGDSV